MSHERSDPRAGKYSPEMETLLRASNHAGRMIRGDWLSPHPEIMKIDLIRDSVLFFDESGVIISLVSVKDWAHKFGSELEIPETTRPGTIWTPGFVDTHVHYPQTQIIGSASGPLLDWLDTSVFPEEAKFAEREYAEQVAQRFCDSMLAHGTTTAAIFSSSHASATDQLFSTLSSRGLGGEVGLTLMDRGAPENVLCSAEEALNACEELIERWHDSNGSLRFCITPRFGLSCTPKLLKGAGELADRFQLLTQTHLSENRAELIATAEAFPEASDYLNVYERFGLLNDRSLFAHCIWLSESEWTRFSSAGASVAHCPDSNFFLGSGAMSLKVAHEHGVRVGLGSDVGAGRSFSMRKACARAYDASRITESDVTPSALYWLATRGGALALKRPELGLLEAGARADLVSIQPPPLFSNQSSSLAPDLKDPAQLIAQLIFCEDWNGTQEVRTNGIIRWCSE